MTRYILFLFFIFLLLFPNLILAGPITGSVRIEISAIVPGCGDRIISPGEQCDGTNLGGSSCSSLGFSRGALLCTTACTFNTTQCITDAPVVGGGGGGGGGIIAPPIPHTNVVFTGRAYPRSTVTLLKDAQVVATTISDSVANFQVSISNIASGNYIFSVYSEDSQGVRSSLLTFPVGVTSGVTTRVSNIFIAPSIALNKSEVRRGDILSIFGQSTPNAEVTISIHSSPEIFVKRMADASGAYLLNFDTTVLEIGRHNARSRASIQEEISSFSKTVGFQVGTRNVMAQLPTRFLRGDVNRDGRVNLVDFSITAFWHRRILSATFRQIETERLNGDGRINLVDFSIIAFNWTG